MIQKIDCFLACHDEQLTAALACQLQQNTSVKGVFFLQDIPLLSSAMLMYIAEKATADYVLLQLKPVAVTLGAGALERMMATAVDTGAVMVYADRYEVRKKTEDGKDETYLERHPVIDYQTGSIRDDFDFGSLLLIRSSLLMDYATQPDLPAYQFAGLYDLRLYMSRYGQLFHLNEYLYTE